MIDSTKSASEGLAHISIKGVDGGVSYVPVLGLPALLLLYLLMTMIKRMTTITIRATMQNNIFGARDVFSACVREGHTHREKRERERERERERDQEKAT